MKEKNLLACLLLGLATLSGCSHKKEPAVPASSDDLNSESIDGSSSSSEEIAYNGDFDLWSEEEKSLMSEYCGAILPHPFDLVESDMTVKEQTGDDSYLVLSNLSDEWTLKDYYKRLSYFGWTVLKGYGGKIIQDRGGVSYVEATRQSEDGKTGYELMYYHVEAGESSGSSYSYNCIVCYNTYSTQKTSKDSWGDDERKAIEYVTSSNIPFFKLGEGYRLYQEAEDQVNLYDYSSVDYSLDIAAVLTKNGFALNAEESEENSCYYLEKPLEDGSTISVLVSYFRGNNVYVYFTPKMDESSSWPSEFLKEEESKSGTSLPVYPISSGGVYKTYTLHGVKYVITYDLKDTYDYYDYVDDINSELFCWEETLGAHAYVLRDDDEQDVGFMLSVALSEPTSTFSSSFPKEAILEGVEDSIGVSGVSIPELDIPSYNLAKQVKYSVTKKEDYDELYDYYVSYLKQYYGNAYSDASIATLAKDYADSKLTQGVTLKVYDSPLDTQVDYVERFKVNEAYKNLLYKAAWYLVPESGGTTYEDPTGQLAIEVSNTPYSDKAYTEIVFKKGSGKTHSPSISFSKSSYNASIGGKFTLSLSMSMLPYDVAYTCASSSGHISVDQTGVVSLSQETEVGEKATITASCVDDDGNTHSATCEIVAIEGMTYKTVLEDVATLLKGQGYAEEDFTREDLLAYGSTSKVVGRKLTLNLGQARTRSEVKTWIKENLVPEKFVSSIWSKYYEDDSRQAVTLGPSASNFSSISVKNASRPSDLEYLYCYYKTDYARFNLYFYIYAESNGDIILYVESRSM